MHNRKIKRMFMAYFGSKFVDKVGSDYDNLEVMFWYMFRRFRKKFAKKKKRFDDIVNELWISGQLIKVAEARASDIEEPEYFVLPKYARIPRFRFIPIPRDATEIGND